MSEQVKGLNSDISFQRPNPEDMIPKSDQSGRPIHPYSHEPMSSEEFKLYMHRLEMQAQSDERLRKALMVSDEAGRVWDEQQAIEVLITAAAMQRVKEHSLCRQRLKVIFYPEAREFKFSSSPFFEKPAILADFLLVLFVYLDNEGS